MKRLLLAFLLLLAPLSYAESEAPQPTPTPAPPRGTGRTQLFQIVLVRGAISGPEEIVGIPKNAEKAIRDIRDFLPFKSYKVLDSALLRLSEDDLGKVQLDGIAPQRYDIGVIWQASGRDKLLVSWFQVVAVRQPGNTPLPKGVAPEAERPIMNTSFSIDTGETIVVGTSKLGGDQALLVLFTALPAR